MSNPLFNSVEKGDKEMLNAYKLAAKSVDRFIDLLDDDFTTIKMAKLQFIDPSTRDTSDEKKFYIWLTNVYYHKQDNVFSASFFEVPPALNAYHSPGDRLGFESDDIFDWVVINDKEHAFGGYTLRVARAQQETEALKNAFDNYVGISSYEPLSPIE